MFMFGFYIAEISYNGLVKAPYWSYTNADFSLLFYLLFYDNLLPINFLGFY